MPTPSVELWLRGRLVRVSGYVEPADRSVGIFGDSFLPEIITVLDGDIPTMHFWNAAEDYRVAEDLDLTDGERDDIDRAFWDAYDWGEYEGFANLIVYRWREDHDCIWDCGTCKLCEREIPDGDPRAYPLAENE